MVLGKSNSNNMHQELSTLRLAPGRPLINVSCYVIGTIIILMTQDANPV